MKKSIVVLFSIIAIAIVSGFVLLNMNYFYNPLTFKKDHITYLEWDWYKKPLVLEYSVLDIEEGWKVYKVNDQREVKFVFDELKKSPFNYDEKFEMTDEIKELIIRSDNKSIVLIVREKADTTFQVNNNTPNLQIDLTEDLMKLFNKRFSQARDTE